ncbi:hypothetical protein BLNAU_11674 [Blattamonas nauphoetae]|uniref:Uncharacterized protein n=1 Tax=Blattamonas nauphoetae TaxID=2049346 RepID=A0ABQ9XPW4_9EUKA|nr:hypothetical protein BLNAU_11674 [Blattamonas nauphoetae]
MIFTPVTATAEPIEVVLPFSSFGSKKSNATLQVRPDVLKGIFTIGEKYTTSFEDYKVIGKEWTVVDPLTTTYESVLTQFSPHKEDGAFDPIWINCRNGMIHESLIAGGKVHQVTLWTSDPDPFLTLPIDGHYYLVEGEYRVVTQNLVGVTLLGTCYS